jgi:hypothetical protein
VKQGHGEPGLKNGETKMKTHNTKALPITAKDSPLRILLPLCPAFTCLFSRSNAVCAAIMLIGLLVCRGDAYSQAAMPGHAQFEAASVDVPAGNTCVLQPEGNADPRQSIPVKADADGVVRFQAVRPTLPNSVDRLALVCTDSGGNDSTYSIDLRSGGTFAPRPFDPSSANLAFRPALTGDPLSFTQQELIQAGYGLRPDPTANPDGYQRWLTAVSVPAYKLRSAAGTSSTRPRSRQLASVKETSDMSPQATVREDPLDTTVSPVPSGRSDAGWTGAVLKGSYQKNATSAQTYSYVSNEAMFVVPTVFPGGLGTGATQMSIWTGLDHAALFQAIVWVDTTATTQFFSIHRQDFASNDPAQTYDGEGIDFTPNSGDLIYAQEWYCDGKGNVNLSGGYACSTITDVTQAVEWECDQANSSECQSFAIKPAFLANGQLGKQAEFIIEGDTDEVTGNCPNSKTNCYDEWPDFLPVTMTGSASVVKGSGVAGNGTVVTANTDPSVTLLTDAVTSIPFERGDGHLIITLPDGAVKWTEQRTNIYYWNGSNFNSLSTPQGTPAKQPGVIFGCASSIGVGPNSRGLTNGTPWTTACNAHADGNYDVNQMQTGGAWVEMEADVATQVAVSPEGDAWAINANGDILYWNGSTFVPNPTGGCATSIAVGANSFGLSHGTPWITGCHLSEDNNYDVYQMQTGGKWVKIQADAGFQIAVAPEGTLVWIINSTGNILGSLGGGPFISVTSGMFYPDSTVPLCATTLAAGPSDSVWFTGCYYSDDGQIGNHQVYQLQFDGTLQQMQANGGTQIAMSPDGNAWLISALQ